MNRAGVNAGGTNSRRVLAQSVVSSAALAEASTLAVQPVRQRLALVGWTETLALQSHLIRRRHVMDALTQASMLSADMVRTRHIEAALSESTAFQALLDRLGAYLVMGHISLYPALDIIMSMSP